MDATTYPLGILARVIILMTQHHHQYTRRPAGRDRYKTIVTVDYSDRAERAYETADSEYRQF
jgi:hypothetical protein